MAQNEHIKQYVNRLKLELEETMSWNIENDTIRMSLLQLKAIEEFEENVEMVPGNLDMYHKHVESIKTQHSNPKMETKGANY